MILAIIEEDMTMSKIKTILIFSLLFLFSTSILIANERYTQTRMNTWLDSQSSFSPANGESIIWSLTSYFYNPISFYEERYRTYHKEITNSSGHTVQDWVAPIQANTTQSNGYTTITMAHYDQNENFTFKEKLVVDQQGRKILYQNLDSSDYVTYNDALYYGTHTQPDYMIINSVKWVFNYDEYDRKSTIDVYQDYGTWEHIGYYDVTYISNVPFPTPLDFTLSYNTTVQEMRTLFDTTFPFDQIIYHPDSGAVQNLNWVCTVGDNVTFTKTIGEPNSTQYDSYVYKCAIDGKFYEYHRNHIYYNETSSRDDYYTWISETVPVLDDYQPTPAITLEQNIPNPFTTNTTIKYKLSEPGAVTLNIYNIKGQLIKKLEESTKAAGQYSISWNGLNNNGSNVSSGIYLVRMQADNEVRTIKVMLLK
jgi:hypothetical protein